MGMNKCVFTACVYSVPDLGELLQCALGDTDPGCFHCGEAAGPCSHHCSGNGPDCQRCVYDCQDNLHVCSCQLSSFMKHAILSQKRGFFYAVKNQCSMKY